MTTLHLVQQQAAVDRMVEVFYTDGKHDCDAETYTPDECIDCLRCGHGECNHDLLLFAGAPGISTHPCTVSGCDCHRMATGDECLTCDGCGAVENDQGREFTCPGCSGQGYR